MRVLNEHASTTNVLIGFSFKICHQIMSVANEDVCSKSFIDTQNMKQAPLL